MKKNLRILFIVVFTVLLGSNSFGQERVQSGIYTIPGTVTFTTTGRVSPIASIGNAIDTLNQYAVQNGGVVVFNIAAGYVENAAKSYSLGGTATNFFATVYTSITFQKSGAGANPRIRAGVGTGGNDFIIQLLGTDNVTFDGIDLVDNPANTSLYNASTNTAPMEYGYYIRNSSTGANYNTIKNCVVRLFNVKTSNTGTVTAADTNSNKSIGIYQFNDNAATINIGNVYDSIWVVKAYRGIFMDGFSGAPDEGTVIRKCIVGGDKNGGSPGDIGSSVSISSTAGYTIGLEVEYNKDISIYDCEIMNVQYYRTTTSGTQISGVTLNSLSGSCSFYRNKVHDIYNRHNSSSGGNAVTGVIISNFAASSTLDFYNNYVAKIIHTNTSQGSQFMHLGISVTACAGNINFYHNAIQLTGSVVQRSAALYVPTGSTVTLNVLNNIFRNSVVPDNTGRLAYEFYYASGTLSKCNYNIYDTLVPVPAISAHFRLGHYLGTDYTSLASWRTAGIKPDTSSPNRFTVSFASTADCHLGIGLHDARYVGKNISTAGYPAISSPAISDDIDNDPRIFYYIGADEPLFTTPTVRITYNHPNDSSVTRGTTQPLAGIALTAIGDTNHINRINFGTAGSYLSTDFINLKLYYSTTNDWVPTTAGGTAQVVPGSNSFANVPAAGATNLNFTFTSFELLPQTGTYYFFVLFDIANPAAVAGNNVRITSLDSSRIYLDAGTTKIGDIPTVFQGGLQTVVDVFYNWGDSLPGIKTAYIDSLEGWYEPFNFTAPLSFASDNQTFVFIHNNSLMAGAGPTGTNWTVTGNNTKIIVGDPTKTAAVTFVATDTIVTNSAGVKIDVKSGGTLRLQTDSIPDFGTLFTGSTVDYNGQSAGQNQKIRNASYYNLILSGLGTRTFAGAVNIAGAFTPNTYTSCPITGVITFNGTTAQTIPGTFTYRGLRINNTSNAATITSGTATGGKVIIDSTLTVSTNFTVSTSDSLVLNATAKVKSLTDTMLVNGKLFNNNPTDTSFLGTTTSTLQFAAGSYYRLDGALVTTSVGQIPAATWAATSNLLITDVRNPTKAIRVGAPTPVGFGNVSFDAPALAVANYKVFRNFMVGGTGSAGSPYLVNIQGDLTLGRTNSLNADLNSDSLAGAATSQSMTVSIAGNLVQRAGTYTFTSLTGAGAAATNNMNVTGKDSINGAYIYSPATGYSSPSFTVISSGTTGTVTVTDNIVMQGTSVLDLSSSGAAKPGTVKAGANFTAGAGCTVTETGTATTNEIQFTKTGTQILTTTGATFANDINYRVLATSITQLGASSPLTVNTGAYINLLTGGIFDITAGNTLTVNGLINTGATLGTFSGTATSNMILGGTAGGSIGTAYFTPGSAILNNLTLDRAGATPSVVFGGTTDLTVHGTITIGTVNASNTIDMGVNALLAGGSFATNLSTANTATLKTQNLTATPIPVNKTWGGTVWYNAAGAQTMVSGSFTNINGTNGNRTLSSTGTIGIAGAGTCFTTGAGVYTVTGSTVDFNGSSAQNIPAFTFENLVISNASTTKTLVGNVAIQESITLSNTTTLQLANFNLSLLSTASKTARLNPVTTAATIAYGGTGQVFPQRYYPARRAWRLVAAPIDPAAGTHSISQAWQERGNGIAGLNYSTPANTTTSIATDTITASYGTLITGGTAANGFDQSPNNATSIKFFNAGSWPSPANTNTLSVNSQEGWMLFVRGDRKNYGQITDQTKTPVITTLRPRGQLFIGTKSKTSTGMTVIGNPYASAVDYNTMTRTGGIWPANPTYYVWDPYLGGSAGVGAFVTLTWNGTNFTRSAPLAGAGTSTYDNRYIPSGAAIIVDFPAGGNLQIKETDKNAANTTTAFRPLPVRQMRTVLNTVNADNSTHVNDGTLSLFDNSFNNAADVNDANKIGNYNENILIAKDNRILSIERRKIVAENDTVFYGIYRLQRKKYQLQFQMENMDAASNLAAFLEDLYLKTKTPVNMEGETNVDFTVTDDAASSAADRFRLVFKRSAVYTAINAFVNNSDIVVEWNVAEEFNINHYEIERSLDGTNFTKAGETVSSGNSNTPVNYNWLDASPEAGEYFYRIRSISNNGIVSYSEAVKVKIVKRSPALYVFPNPVTNGNIQLQLNSAPAGKYTTRLLSSTGQLINTETIAHQGGTATKIIRPSYTLNTGTYQLEVAMPDKKVTVIKVLVNKN